MPVRRWLLPLSVALVTAALLGGAVGLVAGAVAAAAAYRWLPKTPTREFRLAEAEHGRLLRQLPLTADLLAACLASSTSPGMAVAAVARSVESPMRERLGVTAAQLSLGAPPEVCWDQLGVECPPLAPLARCLVRTSLSGAPPATVLSDVAQAQRTAAGRAAHARVRRAGVLATAPLGLCFLPAFVLIGVVPVVMGLTTLYTHRI
jgi:pilus assembly protein TadC